MTPTIGSRLRRTLLCLPWWSAAAALAQAQPGATLLAAGGLADLSLEQLSQVQVTSVSGRPERLRSAAAAIYVITADDIRRSAATSLPEALRLAPNLAVARTSAGQYAISANGFNNAVANKLLVLVDGRTIYSPLFSGVFWDAHHLLLEDIERIEVISGPGGTLWGANAVNGVINVITQPAAATQGALLSVLRSQAHGGHQAARWGGRLGEAGHFRIYGLVEDRNNTATAIGVERPDASTLGQLGFRGDLALAGGALTVQGDAYASEPATANNLASELRGSHLLARWDHRFANGTPYQLQAYYDRAERDDVTLFRNRSETVDLQFSHEPAMPAGQQLLWGAGYRTARDDNEVSVLRFIPGQRRLHWSHVFAQHQLRRGAWQFTAGIKAERNSYTGLEWLPSLRIAYDHANATTWAGVSRAVRAPARLDREFFLPADPPYLIAGGAGFDSEVATVLELGHRGQLGPDFSYSATVFRQQFDGLRAGRGVPAVVANRIDGHSHGLQAWARWQPAPWMRLSAGYVGLRKSLRVTDGPADPSSVANLGNDPRHQWKLQSQFDLGSRVELDFQLRRIGALPQPWVPAYTALDARLGWRLRPDLELSLIAQNVLDREHQEFERAGVASSFGRRLYLRMVWTP